MNAMQQNKQGENDLRLKLNQVFCPHEEKKKKPKIQFDLQKKTEHFQVDKVTDSDFGNGY
jgi:hypothetical protein